MYIGMYVHMCTCTKSLCVNVVRLSCKVRRIDTVKNNKLRTRDLVVSIRPCLDQCSLDTAALKLISSTYHVMKAFLLANLPHKVCMYSGALL